MDVKTTFLAYRNPVNKIFYLNVDSMFFERYKRQLDVETTLCAHWPKPQLGEKFLNTLTMKFSNENVYE